MPNLVEVKNEKTDLKEYNSFLVDIKNKIKLSQQKAFSSVNQEMIKLYFNIGLVIDIRQKELGWGAKVIDKLSLDILEEFPDMKGFSSRNIKRMLRFYKEYSTDFSKVPLTVAQIPWTHNIILIEKIKDKKLRYWYIQKVLENGWSKDVLSYDKK
jgi:predicted nuclease of restriction endonuclease-like (RecB) superfamily